MHLAHFDYDGLGRQVKSQCDANGDGSLADEDTEWTPRDYLGRPLGIMRQAAPTTAAPNPCARPYQLFGYHSTGLRGTGFDQSGGILDCPAVRWRDADDNGTLDEELVYLQDFRGDVTALARDTKSGIVERVRYGMTGRPEVFPPADINFDGEVNTSDENSFDTALNAFASDPADYDPRADLDHDGDVDNDDETLFLNSFANTSGLEGNWKLSQGAGLFKADAPAEGLDNRFGWRGYWYDPKLELYHVRHRVFDPREGRWMQTDPIGFAAGDQDLYRYTNGEYSTGYNSLGSVQESGDGSTATFTVTSDDCTCAGDGGGDGGGGGGGSGSGSRDPFDQLGVGNDRLNEGTRAGQRERSPESEQRGRNVTGVANGLNNGIADAVSGFVQMFNPVRVLEAIQANNGRLNALAEGDPLPMLDHLLAPVDFANGVINRWNNASEEERYYMAAYGTGYVGTTAAMTSGTGAVMGAGMNALVSRRGIGRVYALRGTRSEELWKIGATMRGFDQSGRLIRAAEQIRRLARNGHWEPLDYEVLVVLPRGSTRAALLEAEQYQFRLHDLDHLGCPTLPPGNPVRR